MAVHDEYMSGQRRFFQRKTASLLMSLAGCEQQVFHVDYPPKNVKKLRVKPVSLWTPLKTGGDYIDVKDAQGVEHAAKLREPCPLLPPLLPSTSISLIPACHSCQARATSLSLGRCVVMPGTKPESSPSASTATAR